MNQQETTTALAAELQRIGKMPEAFLEMSNGTGCITDEDYISYEEGIVYRPDVILSALLGVAAEVLARSDIVIRTNGANKFQIYGWLGDSLSPFWFGYYPQAVIAAMKQVENGKQK